MGYTFEDEGSFVSISIPVGAAVSKENLHVQTSGDSIKVSDSESTLLSCIQLYNTIISDQTTWSLKNGELRIKLAKNDPSVRWPALIPQVQRLELVKQ